MSFLQFIVVGVVAVSSQPAKLSLNHIASFSLSLDRLAGLVVKASASRAEGPGFESPLAPGFFGVESYQ